MGGNLLYPDGNKTYTSAPAYYAAEFLFNPSSQPPRRAIRGVKTLTLGGCLCHD